MPLGAPGRHTALTGHSLRRPPMRPPVRPRSRSAHDGLSATSVAVRSSVRTRTLLAAVTAAHASMVNTSLNRPQ